MWPISTVRLMSKQARLRICCWFIEVEISGSSSSVSPGSRESASSGGSDGGVGGEVRIMALEMAMDSMTKVTVM